MKHAELGKNFKVFLKDSEMARFKRVLLLNGAKMASLTRVLILGYIETAEAIESGRTQIDAATLSGAHVTQEELEEQA